MEIKKGFFVPVIGRDFGILKKELMPLKCRILDFLAHLIST